ncbi:3',5'-cyclic-AMP phosphodiesterase [Marinobacter salinisoli]|uniref:3',5'-cyclic-AMP phosphodiesterase n=1 Tax=Marinobacter salinisoli TaxID=2769486 RepID=A0ABX7MY76_9GAMM|nr:3',5'-cyclic-AMP phosphodiesterase [Marinobacter salinisoli]QSP96071.1 3',5'-cyclic-AMP phosphodiesterase [Marinobacter salinisoli]
MTMPKEARPLRVLHLTDPHLMANASGQLLGVNTRDSLAAVIDEVLASHGQPDLILATGDLAQDSSEQAYRVFGERLSVFQCGSAWSPGNHDDAVILNRVASEFDAMHRRIVRGGWQFILLDSSVPGRVYGELAASELEFLEQVLSEYPDMPALVSLHHHPVDIGCDWLENIGLKNRESFWQVIERFPQVKVVLWGHIHQEQNLVRKGVRLLSTPSTCIQFTTGSAKFSVEPLAPGYRWFEFDADGSFTTRVRRAVNFSFELDQSSTGY